MTNILKQFLEWPRADGSPVGPAKTIGEAEAALAALVAEREAKTAAIKDAIQRRQKMLLGEAEDDEIAAVDTRLAELRLQIERIDLAEPILTESLQNLRSAARRAKWNEILARRRKVEQTHLTQLRVFNDSIEEMKTLFDQACAEGFSNEANAQFLPPRIIVSRETIFQFETLLERATAPAPAPKPRPASPPPPPAPVKAAAAPAPVKFLQTHPSVDMMLRRRDRELLRISGATPDDHRAVRFIKNAVDLSDIGAGVSWIGDEVTLPTYQANALVANNCAVFIENTAGDAPAIGAAS